MVYGWGMEADVVSKYVRGLSFVDGRDSDRFVPHFRNLLKRLRNFCDNVTIEKNAEHLEEQMGYHNVPFLQY